MAKLGLILPRSRNVEKRAHAATTYTVTHLFWSGLLQISTESRLIVAGRVHAWVTPATLVAISSPRPLLKVVPPPIICIDRAALDSPAPQQADRRLKNPPLWSQHASLMLVSGPLLKGKSSYLRRSDAHAGCAKQAV